MPKNKGKGGKNRRRGKNENESEKRELVFKEDGQEYAQVIKMLGNGRLEAMCFDGVKRLCHIRGKLRKKVWINTSDIILVGLRDYQDNKADVILKYNADEARSLKAYGELPEHAKINETDTFGPGDDDEIQFDDIGDDDEDIDDLHFYQNPNFKRGCPQLLLRMKRRVGIKNASPATSIAQNFNKKHSGTGNNVGNHNSGFVADTRAESTFSTSTNLSMPPISKPATSQRIANTTAPIRSEFPPPPSTLGRPSEQSVMDQHAVLNQLTTFHMRSHGSYTQANGHIVNFITSTTSTSQYITSPLQRSYFGMMEPSTFPTRYPDLSVNDGPFSNLQPAGNPWFPMPTIADTSAATLSRSTRQPPSLGEHHPNYK
ncbi:heat shock transcription factor, Y-linked isoform X2 [Pteropus alecto]|uniref:heat shock transcription factor, Y-linked isoform X2 n=1 Tax=Pteropus alecto TaxID=9402 RepID=UPI000D534E79|nr:heat shock transcription factor, Y-linked isoform X2 [Pteropus alecto]